MRAALSIAAVLVTFGCGSKPSSSRGPGKWDVNSQLSIFMRKHINPSFSKLSFLMFHDGEYDQAAAAAAASELHTAATNLHAWQTPPGDSAQARQVFYEYAAAFKLDANRLVTAIETGKREDGAKRFEKLREKCDSCHHFFRYGE